METAIYEDDEIKKIIKLYEKNRQRDKLKYQRKKDDPKFIEQNRQRAKNHYHDKYKDVKKDNYEKNKEFMKSRSLFYYYRRNDKVDLFKSKYPDKVKMLLNQGLVIAGLTTGSGSGSG